MRALQITSYGEPLEGVELPDPVAGPGEIVVEIAAAGICRSDLHYRSGTRPVPSLPVVPGHEIAGTVVQVGTGVSRPVVGDRVSLDYLVACGTCGECLRSGPQFCEKGEMLGLDRQGGYANAIALPARNAHSVPAEVSIEAAAIMMCSTVTALHALRRGRAGPGQRVAVIGVGGLGMSAIQLARVLECEPVLAIDIDEARLAMAEELGAVPVDGSDDPLEAVLELVPGGVDVAVELVGSADLMRMAVAMLRSRGRAVAVGITETEFGLDPFRDLVRREAEIIGTADHVPAEIDEVLGLAARGAIDVDRIVTSRVPLDAGEVDTALDRLEEFGPGVRTVIEPGDERRS